MHWWEYVDNGMGNILVRVAAPDFSEYALRLHDLDGYHRLNGLWVEMLAAGVDAEAAGAFIAKSDARFHDPYTQKPMAWDAASKQISFRPQSASSSQQRYHAVQGRVFVQW